MHGAICLTESLPVRDFSIMNTIMMPKLEISLLWIVWAHRFFCLWLIVGTFIPDGFFQQFTLNEDSEEVLTLIQIVKPKAPYLDEHQGISGPGFCLTDWIPVGLLIGQPKRQTH